MPRPRNRRLSSGFSSDDYEMEDDAAASRDAGLFGWTIAILLLVGVAIVCWVGSFYIFGHPEKPFSYQILTKLKKLDPPKRFDLTDAPRGEFLKPQQIYERYLKMTPRELMRANEALLRNYLRNYKLTQDLVPYIVGTYNILDSYQLTKDDFFGSGVVAIATAKDDPKLLLEQVFSAQPKVVPALHRTLLTGLDIDFKRENDLSAIIHVEKLADGRIKATAISVLYPSYESATSSGTFTLEPPETLNVAAGLPVTTVRRQKEADEKYAAHRRKAGLAAAPAATPPPTRLMRVERPVAVNPAQQPGPIAAATPATTPANPKVLPAIPVGPNPPVAKAVAATAAASPVPSASPSVAASPAPSASPAASPLPAAAAVAASSGAWPVYEPGKMPRGRLVGIKDVSAKGGFEAGSERAYLQGNFLVTAAGPNRAVLRNQGAITDAIGLGGRTGNVRIIVDFPPGARPPGEGTTFSRDAQRPFQITEVREGADGQINVYVREVTRP